MANLTPALRKQIETKVFDTMSTIDPSGINADKYKKIFKEMSNDQFLAYFKKMANDDNMNFYVEMDFYGKNKVTMQSIQKAAKVLHVPLEEHVYIRHTNPDGEPIKTPFKVPVMYVHLKSKAPLYQ